MRSAITVPFRSFLIFLCLGFCFAEDVRPEPKAVTAPSASWTLYGGVGSPTALTSLIRFSEIDISPKYLLTLAFSQPILAPAHSLGLEGELSVSKFLERGDLFALNGALVGRVHKLPWERVLPGSFAFGAGLSWATGIPDLELQERTSRTLFHLLFELEFGAAERDRWNPVFRIHHRSGVFGLFNEVAGGSDYLCVGVKRRL